VLRREDPYGAPQVERAASSGTGKRPGATRSRKRSTTPGGVHRITLTDHQVGEGRALHGGEHAPRLLPVPLPHCSTSTGPCPRAAAARDTLMIECIRPGRDASEPPPRAAEPRSRFHSRGPATRLRNGADRASEKSSRWRSAQNSRPVTGTFQGSETGEQRCPQPHATALNCNTDEPSDS